MLDEESAAFWLTRDVLEILILAIVQGIAEFLPVSSSGHLVVLGNLLGKISTSPAQEIILHLGTLGSILVVFWKRILDLLKSDRRVVPLLVVGTIPAAVVGLTIKALFEDIMHNPILVGFMLLLTGVMLIVLGRLQPREGEYQQLSLWRGFLVGCFQAFAVLPGISRSGSTILGGRLLGLKNEDSVTFSFLLAIPAILGASVLTCRELWETGLAKIPFTAVELIVGAIASFLVGIFALRWLIGWSRQDRLHWFAWWCIPAGVFVLVFFGYFK